MEWPNLSEIKHVSGRPATQADVDEGAAVFLIQVEGENIGVPLDIEIPQYAMHKDEESGVESPVIVVQAEEGDGAQIIGVLTIPDNEIQVGLIHEYRFLGAETPTE